MKCKCPACGRTTPIPPDLLDFLTRCERCCALLRPRLTSSGHQGQPEKLIAQIIISGRYREDPFVQRATILDVLTPTTSPRASATFAASPSAATQKTESLQAVWHATIQNAIRGLADKVTEVTALAANSRTALSAPKKSPAPKIPPIQKTETPMNPEAQSPIQSPIETAPSAPQENLEIEAASLEARQLALLRAKLQTSHHALGWLGACGFAALLVLAGAILILKSTGFIGSPRTSFGGIMSAAPSADRTSVSTDVLESSGTQPASTQPGELFPSVGAR